MLRVVKEYLYTNFHKVMKKRKNEFLSSRKPTWLSRSINTAVCEKHWPNDAEVVQVHGKLRTKNPLSAFPGISSSCLSSQLSDSRKTNRTLSQIRNRYPDEMEELIKADTLVYHKIANKSNFW